MHHFQYQSGNLHCEQVPVADIAAEVGTPVYIYSSATLRRHFKVFDKGFDGLDHLTCFAVKCCSNIAILNIFAQLGGGADIVSGGELYRALKAGVAPDRIIYSGVGKTAAEIREALLAGIRQFNVESLQELERLQHLACDLRAQAPVALRINPDVDPRTHAYISTGLAKNKFGIPVDEAVEVYRQAREMHNIEVTGVSCHIGSQLTEVGPFIEALAKVKAFIGRLQAMNIPIRTVDLGGGLGITYDAEEPPTPAAYAEALRRELGDLDCTLIFEPGRVIAGNSGILVTEVQYTKVNSGGEQPKNFVIVDAAMNDLARPSLYGAFHAIKPVHEESTRSSRTVDIVGPICETGDFLARDRLLPRVEQGELLAVMSCGAYGFSMSSNYNSRPRAAEVLVSGDQYRVIRRREDYEDLVRGEEVVTC